MPVLNKRNDLIQQIKQDLLKACKLYYEPTGDEESPYTDAEYEMDTRYLYRLTYKNPLEYIHRAHYRQWCNHMGRVYGFGWNNTEFDDV